MLMFVNKLLSFETEHSETRSGIDLTVTVDACGQQSSD